MGLFNATCPLPKDAIDAKNAEKPVVGNVTFQHLEFYIAAGFSCICVSLMFFVAVSHLSCYVKPREQRQIIRICFYPVTFAICSAFSIFSYPVSIYAQPAAAIYEPVSLAAIFFLFVEFSAGNPESRESYFYELEHKRQTGPRFGKKKWTTGSGGSLRWYQAKYVAVFFYFVNSIIIHTIELITQGAGVYCMYSFSPAFAHFWVTIISSILLPIGVVAVIQFWQRMMQEPHFKARGAMQKLLAFKAVLLLNFFQDIVFLILISTHAVKNHPTVTVEDVSIGLRNLLVCTEQALVSIWFLWAYSAKEYREIRDTTNVQPKNIFAAAADALNPTDLVVGSAYAVKLLLKGVGPRGNGSWRRNGGYEKMKDATDVRLHGVTSYNSSQTNVSQYPQHMKEEQDNEETQYLAAPRPSYGGPRSDDPRDIASQPVPAPDYDAYRYDDPREYSQEHDRVPLTQSQFMPPTGSPPRSDYHSV